MAGRRVNYSIHSTDKTKTGIASAMRNLQGFDAQVGQFSKRLNSLFKYGGIVQGARMVSQQIKKMSDTFKVQETADRQLAQAVINNPLLNGDAFKALREYNGELQKNSVYGDEQLNTLAAQLAAQGKAEQQIKDILSASANLASAGVMPLESAVKNLAKTYSGTAGELAESIPALKTLTKEQLANGEGVAIVAEQYRGMAEAMTATRDGTKQMADNLKGDITENLGDIFTTIVGDFNKLMLPLLQKVNDWLNDNKDAIINVFRNLPEIAAKSFNLIKGAFGKVFTTEFWESFGTVAWDYFKASSKNAFNVIGDFLNAIATTFWEPLKWGFDSLVFNIKTAWRSMIDNLREEHESLARGVHDFLNNTSPAYMLMTKRKSYYEYYGTGSGGRDDLNGPGDMPMNKIAEAWENVLDSTKAGAREQFDLIKRTWTEIVKASEDVFGEDVFNYFETMKTILGVDVVTALEEASSGLSATAEEIRVRNNTPVGAGLIRPPSNITSFHGATGVYNGPSDFMVFLNTLKSSFGSLTDAVLPMIQSLSSVNALMNWQMTILEGVLSVLGPVIDSLLTPLVGILRVMGQTIGAIIVPALQFLHPIIETISNVFIWLYNNAIRPFANALISLGGSLYNGFIELINAIISAINKIPGVDVKKQSKMDISSNWLEEIDSSSLYDSGEAGMTSSSSGTSATYTGGQNITNNWYINIGAMTGDQETFEEFVRLITLEQTRAERVGLA